MVGADLQGADVDCDAGDEEQVAALVEHAVARPRRARHLLRQCRHLGRARRRSSSRSPGDWAEILRVNLIGPFLAIKHAAPRMKAARRRVDHLHRLGRGPALGRGRAGLFGVEGGGDQPGQDRRAAARRLERPRQRHLPRADRNRHDRIRLRARPRQGAGGPPRPPQPAEARRRSRSKSPTRRCSSPPTNPATSTAMRWSSTAAFSASHPFNHQSYGRTAIMTDVIDKP